MQDGTGGRGDVRVYRCEPIEPRKDPYRKYRGHGIWTLPSATQIHIGDVIEWSNRDYVAHTVTARDDVFDVAIPSGKKGRHNETRGRAAFFCRYHPTMTGEVSVAP
jgi:plastocyanin